MKRSQVILHGLLDMMMHCLVGFAFEKPDLYSIAKSSIKKKFFMSANLKVFSF